MDEEKVEGEKEMTDEELLAYRGQAGKAVCNILETLQSLVKPGQVETVLDTVEAFYGYTPLARAQAFVTDAMETGAPIAASLFPMVMQVADQFTQADHAQRARRVVAVPFDLEEALRQIRQAEAEAAASPSVVDAIKAAHDLHEKIRAKREISQEELDKVSENLIQCEACNAAWPDPNHDKPCCPACGKPAY